MRKAKYHRGKAPEDRGKCMGKHCLICHMNGREKDLYGYKVTPLLHHPTNNNGVSK